MAVSKQREGVWRVEAYHADALPGFQRVRRTFHGSIEEARELEAEILTALQEYGQWPVPDNAKRLDTAEDHVGNIRHAARLCLENHWGGGDYYKKVEYALFKVIRFLERRKKRNFEDVTSADIEALVKCERENGNTANTINHHLSYLRTVNTYARERKPPITEAVLPIKRLRVEPIEKWWLTPENLEKVLAWLEGRRDPIFADYVQTLCYQGLRPEEGLRLTPRSFTGLNTAEPWIVLTVNKAGKKTGGSAATIPMFDLARPVIERAVKRAKANKWDLLFPLTQRQARERWNEVRAMLGVSDVETATLRALRRTFAYYANLSSMPTRVLQKILRHTSITTTEGYLTLAGTNELDHARDYMKSVPMAQPNHQTTSVPTVTTQAGSDWKDIIAAYRETGASPAEVAQFVKELMRA